MTRQAQSTAMELEDDIMKRGVRPLHDRIIVKLDQPPKGEIKLKSGLVLPAGTSVTRTGSIRGKVLDVGPGKVLPNGERSKFSVKKGDDVLLSRYAGTEIKNYLFVLEDDILGILDEETPAPVAK